MEKIAILADSGCQIPVGSKEDQGIFIAATYNHYGREKLFR